MNAQYPDFSRIQILQMIMQGNHTDFNSYDKKTDNNGNYLHYDFNPLDVTTFYKNYPTQPSGNVLSISNNNLGTETILLNHRSIIPPATPIVETY